MFKYVKLFILIAVLLLTGQMSEAALNNKLNGKVLLQTESTGDAWYVNPADSQRYALVKINEVTKLINTFGLKVKASEFRIWKNKAPKKLAGRIIIVSGSQSQAYYIDPVSLTSYSLGRPQDTINTLRSHSFEASDLELSKIKIGSVKNLASDTVEQKNSVDTFKTEDYSWHYKNKLYKINLKFSDNLYQNYQSSPHFFSYKGTPPADWKETFYGMFFKIRPEDGLVKAIVKQLKEQAEINNLNSDELVELTMAFAQSVPYDNNKAGNKNAQVNYPYETLYDKLGVCSDKALLVAVLFRELGYGAAILVYPDKDHATVGIECPAAYALAGTNYCFAESTDFFPIGFVPQTLDNSGVAIKPENKAGVSQFTNTFSSAALGSQQIYQASHGKIYHGIINTYQKIEKLKTLEAFLTETKPLIDALKPDIDAKLKIVENLSAQVKAYKNSGNISAYNQMLPEYNNAVRQYNDAMSNFTVRTGNYNNSVATYSQTINELYVAGK